MSNLKTFQQILDEGYQFPLTIDTATQQTITEWFQFRKVADNDQFIAWFNRQLTLNYPYYRQLLRIDPSTSSFDWLIMQYSEHESITSSESNQSGYTSVEGTTVNKGTSENVSTSSGTSNVTSKMMEQPRTKQPEQPQETTKVLTVRQVFPGFPQCQRTTQRTT